VGCELLFCTLFGLVSRLKVFGLMMDLFFTLVIQLRSHYKLNYIYIYIYIYICGCVCMCVCVCVCVLPNARILLLMKALLFFMSKLTMEKAEKTFIIIIIIIAKYIIKER
jgi:hypothetical protein